jgi:hypothetical protein
MFALGGDSAEAERQFRRTIELNPDYYEAHFALVCQIPARGNVQEGADTARSPDPQLRSAASRLR